MGADSSDNGLKYGFCYVQVGTFQEKICLRLVCARAHGILCTSSHAQELVRTDTSFCVNIYDKYVLEERGKRQDRVSNVKNSR